MEESQGRDESLTKGPTLDWMYKGPASLVNREDYLLGRTVDKSLKILEEAEKGNSFSYAEEVEKDLTPASIFASRGPSGPVDVIRKIKEDPLYQIQKKEEESLKQLLKNPVRMKQLQKMAEDRQKESSSSSSKKHKKKHKRKKNSDSSDSEPKSKKHKSSSYTSNIVEKYKRILEEDSSSDSDTSRKESSRKKHRHDRNSGSTRSHSESNTGHSYLSHRNSGRDQERDRNIRHPSAHDSRYKDRRDRRDYRNERNTRDGKGEGSITNSYGHSSNTRKKLDEDEMERKRLEMMDNAKWRESQLKSNVNKYREKDRKEEEKSASKPDRDPDFIRKQLIAAANSGSVEQRIKSNSYNIQRSKASMTQNFVRK